MKRNQIPGDPLVAARVRGARASSGLTQKELAERVSVILRWEISRSIISNIELGNRDVESRLLSAIAVATGEDYDRLIQPLRPVSDKAIPGYLNPDAPVRSRIDHELGDCIGCLIDRDFHVLDEWNYRDPIAGQISIDLRDGTFAIAS